MIYLHPYLVLGIFFAMLIMSAISFIGNISILLIIKSYIKNDDISACLFIYFYVTIFSSLFTFQYAAVMISFFNYDFDYNLDLIFYSTLISKFLSSAPSITLLFISVERCLIMIYKNDYRPIWTKYLTAGCIASIIVCAVLLFAASFIFKKHTKHPACISVNCVLTLPARALHAIITVVVGICIFTTLVIYMYEKVKYIRYRNSMAWRTNNDPKLKMETMVLQNLICSIVLYILPAVLGSLNSLKIIQLQIIPQPPIAVFTLLLDCFCCTITNIYLVTQKALKLKLLKEKQKTYTAAASSCNL